MADVFHRPQRLFPIQALLEALDSLRLLGKRSVLALLGIAVGCAAVVALLNIGHNAAHEATHAFKEMGTNILVATFPSQLGKHRPVVASSLDARALRLAVSGVAYVTALSPFFASIRHSGHVVDATIHGTTPQLLPVLELQLTQGRFLSDFDRSTTYAVVGASVAKKLEIQVGDRLPIEGYLFEVVGITVSTPHNLLVSVSPDDSIFIPIEGMRRLRPTPEIGSIVAQVKDTSRLTKDSFELKTYLQEMANGREVEVQVPQKLLEGLTRQANAFSYLLVGLGGISLLVGGVGIMNVMLMNVAVRRREIGVRMSLGARARDIRNLFLFEAAVLSIAGAFLGTAIGLACAYAFVKFSGWAFSLSPLSLPLGMCSALAVGIFFGLHPAQSAARLQPVQALRDD